MHATVEARVYCNTDSKLTNGERWITKVASHQHAHGVTARVRFQSGRRLLCMRSLKVDTLRTILVWLEGAVETGRAWPGVSRARSWPAVPSSTNQAIRLSTRQFYTCREFFGVPRSVFLLLLRPRDYSTFSLLRRTVQNEQPQLCNRPTVRQCSADAFNAFNQSIMFLIDTANPITFWTQDNPPSLARRTSAGDVV